MDPLLQILKRLHDHSVEFIVVGGMAAIMHGGTVVTRDVDVVAPLHLRNLEAIVAALWGLNPRFRFALKVIPLHELAKDLVGFKNLNLNTDLGVIDILGELPGVGPYESFAERAIDFDAGEFHLRLLDIDTLIAAKSVAGRPKDHAAIMELQAIRKRTADGCSDGEHV